MVIPWTLQRGGRRRITTPKLPSYAPLTRSGQAGTGRRVLLATRSVCADGAICRRTWQIQRRLTTQYHPREDSTLTQSVSPGHPLLHVFASVLHPPLTCHFPRRHGLMQSSSVVFRGPHDRYEHRDPSEWRQLPVVSVVPTRWPKLKDYGTCYSFDEERDLVKTKLRAALTICVHQDIRSVVIGDFGLGSYRNPPQALAEMWREVFLWDPNLRGRVENVAFVFEDRSQSTVRLILEEAAKKSRMSSSSSSGSSSSSNKSKSKASSSSGGGGSGGHPTDFDIYSYVFSSSEVTRVLTQPDTRMGVQNLMS